MSGGFFRGTSADQDTRFSNKQAKLLKSQKFASELEHLVDMTRVKMDVMRPWIAQRVTELLGFEDEVLINFIYGLLEGKEVNGKEVQISLTGFMEKNTGKFMKELWQLLLSAQNNSSGVPQQFLDAKQEETRKNKAETDRIKSEMQKKKEEEGREIEEEKMRKLDGEAEKQRVNNATLEPSLKHHPEAFTVHSADDKEIGDRNGVRGRSRLSKSPHSLDRVPLSPRRRRSRSMSKSFSNSRSYSEERRESRGLSRSPSSRGRSISSERVPDSPPRRSIRPRRQHSPMRSRSPPIRRSSHSRRRSTSRSRRLSPSPVRRRMRTPSKYRSRSPIRRRSRTPVRHRSRSPLRHRSRSPMRRRYRTPVQRRSRTPMRGRSPSPFRRRYRRSPSTPLRRSPSPVQRRSRISNRRRSLTPSPPRYRSPSREEFSSPSPVRRLSPSSVKKGTSKCQGPPVSRPRERTRAVEKFSPVYHARRGGSVENSDEIRKGLSSPVHRPSVSLRSPQRDFRVLGNTCRKEPSSPPSPYRSQFHSESPPVSRRSPNEDKRSYSPYQSPVMQSKGRKGRDTRENYAQKPKDQRRHYDIPESTKEGELDRARDNGDQKFKSSEGRPATSSKLDTRKDVERVDGKHDYSPERSVGRHSIEARNHSDGLELRKKGLETKSAKISTKVINQEDSVEGKRGAISNDSKQADEKVRFRSDKVKHSKWLYETESAVKAAVEVDEKDGSGSLSSGSDYSFKRRSKDHEHRKHRRSGKKEVTSDDSYDSELEDRKEAKRRKKEKKRLKKEERRRRKEERRRRREERRAEKLKAKSKDASDAEETVSEQKKLEMQLREKALESLRAKKGVGH